MRQTDPAPGRAEAMPAGRNGAPGGAPTTAADEIDRLVELLGRLPGLGPRSARRAVLHLLDRRATLLEPLAALLRQTAERIRECETCGNLTTGPRCGICADPDRDGRLVCVVETVADLWALERTGSFRGRYHVLGGCLSAIGNTRPEDLRIPELVARSRDGVAEVVLALNATFDGQTTAHYLVRALAATGVRTTRIGFGVPVGGELDYLDPDTITAAFRARAEA